METARVRHTKNGATVIEPVAWSKVSWPTGNLTTAADWIRGGHFGNNEDKIRGALELAHQQGLDGCGTSVAAWMGLTEDEYSRWFRGTWLPSDERPAVGERVYFIQAEGGGPIKIGCSSDPQARLRSLQTGHYSRLVILGVRTGGYFEEARLHKKYAVLRLEGEWFTASPELLSEIRR